MRFAVAAVVAFGIMTIDFRANDNNLGNAFTEAAAQAEHQVQSAEPFIGKEDVINLEANDASVVSEAVPQATEPVQELPKKNFAAPLRKRRSRAISR